MTKENPEPKQRKPVVASDLPIKKKIVKAENGAAPAAKNRLRPENHQQKTPASNGKTVKPHAAKPAHGDRQPSEFRQLYSALSKAVTAEKEAGDRQPLSRAIDDFTNYLKPKMEDLIKTMMGSRGIQLCLKHGSPSQREHILLMVMKLNILKLINSKYGVFVIHRVFKYCPRDPQFKLLRQFVENNLDAIIKTKDGVLVVGAFMSAFNAKQQAEFLLEKLPLLEFHEFYLTDMLAEKIFEKRYLTNCAVHAVLFKFYDKIGEKKEDLFANLLNFQRVIFRKKDSLIPYIGLLFRLYRDVPWAS